jgi:hypothetical protein
MPVIFQAAGFSGQRDSWADVALDVVVIIASLLDGRSISHD